MNVKEMRFRFQELYEEALLSMPLEAKFIDSNTVIKYLEEAQVSYLNGLIVGGDYVNTIISTNSNLAKIRDLVETKEVTQRVESSIYHKAFRIDITEPYILPIDVIVDGAHTQINSGNSKLSTSPINFVEIRKYLTNAYNTPIILKPAFTIDYNGEYEVMGSIKGSLLLFIDKYTTINTIYVTSLRMPKKLSLTENDTVYTTTCELETYIHEDIIRLAVDKALQDKVKLSGGGDKE